MLSSLQQSKSCAGSMYSVHPVLVFSHLSVVLLLWAPGTVVTAAAAAVCQLVTKLNESEVDVCRGEAGTFQTAAECDLVAAVFLWSFPMKLQLTCCLFVHREARLKRSHVSTLQGSPAFELTTDAHEKSCSLQSCQGTPCCMKHGTQSNLRLGPILPGGSAYTEFSTHSVQVLVLHPQCDALPCSTVPLIQLLVQAEKRGDAQAHTAKGDRKTAPPTTVQRPT